MTEGNQEKTSPPGGPQRGGRSTVVVAIVVGCLGLVAVQGFTSHAQQAQSSEAEDRVSEMFRSAVSYAYGPLGQNQPKFPASTSLTPAQSCCTSPDRRCDPAVYGVTQWDAPTWQALNFAFGSPHSFRYQFVSDGSSFTARAVGDLDCDGNSLTLERTGTLLPDGDVQGSRGIARSGAD